MNGGLSGIRTVGQLREALDGVADDTPLIVNAADAQDADFADEQVITSAGFGSVDWGDGRGLQRDIVFGLNCRRVSLEELDGMRRRPDQSPGQGEPGGEVDWPPPQPRGRTAMALCLQAVEEDGSLPLDVVVRRLADSDGYSASAVMRAVQALQRAGGVSVEGTGPGAVVSPVPVRRTWLRGGL